MGGYLSLLLFGDSLDALGADAQSFAVHHLVLQVNVKAAFSFNIGVAARSAGNRATAAFFTTSSHMFQVCFLLNQ